MEEAITVQGRRLSEADLDWIRSLIASNPCWNRTRISREICHTWAWKDEIGRYKDMACRTMLIKLERRGLIALPASQCAGINKRRSLNFQPVFHDKQAIHGDLKDISPVSVLTADKGFESLLWQTLLHEYHYLGFKTRVGKSIAYLAFDRFERPVAALLFGAAAWKVAGRDRFIGWNPSQRKKNLKFIANNMRFLIPPWVRVPHLASHLLGLISRRISGDWVSKYGHPITLLETFVEKERFSGTCYKASNWQTLGETTGRTRNDTDHQISAPVKIVMVLPLRPDFRKVLLEE